MEKNREDIERLLTANIVKIGLVVVVNILFI